ncbi:MULTISPECIES: glutaredoxin family protein [unclassified Alcanivorax]|jgi:glutaredoxin|uniref:glutaredoxin family protein n=1 Tax=Alcanivorax TaxID=59753 RepID=UPI000789CFFD|nr:MULTISPECIES: glutaredoxin family protein [unclassified Alcanivorax]KZX76335.1 glutaredoxin [Alcanivorax sp. HI0013]KZX77690.1 glutaredoxin [Alcanivorax sp. HI0011]KZY19892.1 glutaredoxin [Alcanivorax sp. HI0035]MED5239947.1 glutaredoxin family protein [Pseudomonadota bacterium]KZX67996.1 glutaredoxin [Alcanivorax sp. HI0007]
MSVVLYTTVGCHLCEQARELVSTVAPDITLTLVDVAEDDELLARYGERIPVLMKEGRELGWPFGLLDVQQFLAG